MSYFKPQWLAVGFRNYHSDGKVNGVNNIILTAMAEDFQLTGVENATARNRCLAVIINKPYE